MHKLAQMISNRLSLRDPQRKSLEILAGLCEELTLEKGVAVTEALQKVKSHYPACTDFERDFPSICFALATGVGKTRLMGAFISYLFIAKGMRNFFVLTPNLTIYNKLIDDLSVSTSPKYVFRGIGEFASAPPRIITGDNYSEARQAEFFHGPVNINIFNISKINSEVRSGREPRIKRLSEYLGDSYFNYLSSLSDLVLLMDESHHYRADAGMRAINELKPVLGLELTATPIDTHGNTFKNVVFDYPLALALRDGFVKEPAVATRKDFNPDRYRHDPNGLDQIKLEDGIRIHEDTKVALDIYARNTGNKLVKPFVLVVAKDTEHASEIRKLIESDRFFEGRYRDKVMEIHSSQRGSEKEENVQKLLRLEHPESTIEIVVHVNMLKEGWDVTNLYTIIPLRASNSQILTEQTIGRGLRLPYGRRTGEAKVDKLTIIAHDRFQAIVDAANDPSSIIRKENIIEIDPSTLPKEQEIVVGGSVFEEEIAKNRKEIECINDEFKRKKAMKALEAQGLILETISGLGREVKNLADLKTEEVRAIAIGKMIQRIESAPQQDLFKQEMIDAVNAEYETVVETFTDKVIPIPRSVIQQKENVKSGFHDFDLDVRNLNYQPVSEEILRRTLRMGESDTVSSEGEGVIRDTPENILVNELMNYSEVDYDRQSNLLYKLAGQATQKLGDGRDEKDLRNIVLYQKRQIGEAIYAQLKQHFYLESAEFEKSKVLPFTKIEPHNLSKYTKDKIHHYTDTITPTNSIPSKIFGGYKKACHSLYKFHAKAEKDFSVILEDDGMVLKWLRPAQAQFQIYWQHNSRQYTPDFVVETKNAIYMIEIKAERDIDDFEVQAKTKAAERYCEVASKYNAENGGKPWRYVLIPHTAVMLNMSFKSFVDATVRKPQSAVHAPSFPFELVPDSEVRKNKNVTYLPVLSLEAAASGFSAEQHPEPLGWGRVDAKRKLDKDMFIARVVGKSMEPTIPDGSYCIFRRNPAGSREGKIVLVESRLVTDPETNQRFTVKRYHSEKKKLPDGTWRHVKITLSPDNKDFDDIVLKDVNDGDFHVTAEFVEIL